MIENANRLTSTLENAQMRGHGQKPVRATCGDSQAFEIEKVEVLDNVVIIRLQEIKCQSAVKSN